MSKDAIDEMDKAGYRPATLAELLALGEFKPKLQKQFEIVALGTVWHRYVPFLTFDGAGRGVTIFEFNNSFWSEKCCFLSVRR